MSFNFSPKIVTDGLVLYLDAANTKSFISGSTTWNDISKNKNDGTLINGPTFNPNNMGSIVFDGLNDYVNCGKNSSILFLNNSPYTLSVFTKIVNFKSTYPSWIRREDFISGVRNGYNLLYTIEGQPSDQVYIYTERFSTAGSSGTGANVSRSSIQGSWVYISSTYDGSTLKMYLNGELLSQTTSLGNIINITSNFLIGFPGFINYNNCNIATVNIYNRDLSLSELKQNYNTLKTRFGL
jgi:hypothetical protein